MQVVLSLLCLLHYSLALIYVVAQYLIIHPLNKPLSTLALASFKYYCLSLLE